jgi:hypothetical protein
MLHSKTTLHCGFMKWQKLRYYAGSLHVDFAWDDTLDWTQSDHMTSSTGYRLLSH